MICRDYIEKYLNLLESVQIISWNAITIHTFNKIMLDTN